MDQMMAMVKHVSESSDATRTLPSFDSVESTGLASFASTSTSDEMGLSGEWTDREFESNEGSSTVGGVQATTPYRIFFDSREKKLMEKIEFVKIVAKHRNVLFGECDGHEVTPRAKEEAWKRVASEVNLLGLDSFKGKPWARLRDHDWQYVRRHALARTENVNKPTGKLGELDKIVLDIIATTTLSITSQQAFGISSPAENMEKVLRHLLGGSNSDSLDTSLNPDVPTPNAVGEKDEEDTPRNRSQDENVSNSNGENFLEMLSKSLPLTVDPNAQPRSEKSPIPRKIGSRSATAPSVYSITSSTSPTQLSNGSQPAKKPRIELETFGSPTYEKKKEALELRKIELEVKQIELVNQKLIKEIAVLEGQERRASELHALEMRAAKARLFRSPAIDESSTDPPRSSVQINGF